MKALVICNPRAGRRAGDAALTPALDVLREANWDVDVCATTGPGDATVIAHSAAARGVEAVLVAGGDGTINETVQALANTETALGYLPYGTVNVWARELGISRDVLQAAQAIVDGRIERIDLGRAGERYFLLMSGVGFDGYVIRRARRIEGQKQRFGVLPYLATGLSAAPLYRGADIELRYDGIIRRVKALMLVVGNTRLYGGRFQLTPDAVANDGWLDLCIIKGRGPLALMRHSLPLLLSGTVTHSDVELLRVRNLAVHCDITLPFQVDGELAGVTPVNFTVAPRALRAIIPRGFVSTLIT